MKRRTALLVVTGSLALALSPGTTGAAQAGGLSKTCHDYTIGTSGVSDRVYDCTGSCPVIPEVRPGPGSVTLSTCIDYE